jgi:hypothetical protein
MTKRTLLRMIERERQAFAAERAQLLSTICTLAGNSKAAPIPPAPAPAPEKREASDDDRRFISSPEQLP